MTEATDIGREEIEAWLLEYHRASGSLDADSWLDNFYTEDISLQYANLPILSGASVRQTTLVLAFTRLRRSVTTPQFIIGTAGPSTSCATSDNADMLASTIMVVSRG
ncbi:uncharacterized protein NECHADRAFT_82711 [Fusarium vanettenii 77-13-4]|uniref:SnoaL-like domain-containing protein n=1 Tax=Fusarium vanettenii (strain ATCC MYA-4622 / CBS 123669 / FGSC 9596 / NRRL 45880 / 77-13-4) TaxID=660122 RepID=C7YY04_FUSV7|nr:uncharacterized protein NECHADRAFT_82711 [Fusarium vanettenii 77-13-4]EEU43426.1 predicted protein [Fusarium vanettenii 77-13-4]